MHYAARIDEVVEPVVEYQVAVEQPRRDSPTDSDNEEVVTPRATIPVAVGSTVFAAA